MMQFPWGISNAESGQGLVEYALILMLVAAVVFAGLSAFGVSLSGLYDQIAALPL
jgi:Flp pilus assembly pilin Flp